MSQGKLIVLYGINNLGKTTQAKRIVERLTLYKKKAYYLKFPLYDLHPSGPILNNYLREGNTYNLTPREFQLLMIQNRTHYNPRIRSRLEHGEWIVAEDYIGTGVAWGMGAGIDKDFLVTLNSHLVPEDLGIYFRGKRFLQARERDHQHETDDALTEAVRVAHEALAREYAWQIVHANDDIQTVEENVWSIVTKKLHI